MKISARNQIKGKVIKLDIGSGNIISATVFLESVKELGIKEGKKGCGDYQGNFCNDWRLESGR